MPEAPLPSAPTTPARLLCARGVCKSFVRGDTVLQVLENLDLDVGNREWVALMGPSGSGKSTLLNQLGGLDVPDAGSIQVAGQEIVGLTPAQLAGWRSRTVGFVFQLYNLLPVLTARQNVELPLLLTPLSRRERRDHAEAALELVGLSDRMHHLPSQLSGGQQQRVAIARAIVTDPTFLLADEPTGDLDATSAEEILQLLGLLCHEHGKAIVMVTHDPHAAEHADRLVQLEKGGTIALPPRAVP